jgi:UDP:flavonoid glycosyltransferase YjiC (YdhE family)
VRVIATWNGREPPEPLPTPANAVVVPWLSYEKTMSACDAVVCHGGHGTLARALSCGCAVVVCPAGGDMAENAARADWAGVGVRLPRRLLGPRTVRLAVWRALSNSLLRARARAVAAWMEAHDAPTTAALEIERWAPTTPRPSGQHPQAPSS